MTHTLSRAKHAASWGGRVGRINADMVAKHLPPANDGGDVALAFMCGPAGMQETCQALLAAAGYLDERVHIV